MDDRVRLARFRGLKIFFLAFLGLTPRALCSRLLRRLTEVSLMRWIGKQACLWGIILLTLLPAAAGGQTRFVATRGKELAAPDGKPLLLKGINLGNCLLPEGYMFKFKTTNST